MASGSAAAALAADRSPGVLATTMRSLKLPGVLPTRLLLQPAPAGAEARLGLAAPAAGGGGEAAAGEVSGGPAAWRSAPPLAASAAAASPSAAACARARARNATAQLTRTLCLPPKCGVGSCPTNNNFYGMAGVYVAAYMPLNLPPACLNASAPPLLPLSAATPHIPTSDTCPHLVRLAALLYPLTLRSRRRLARACHPGLLLPVPRRLLCTGPLLLLLHPW